MNYWSQTFIPTLKESPADAEIASHKLLLRAGLVRKLGAGSYTYMPSGLRTLQKIMRLCREEMDREGAIELSMPHIHPVENWLQGPRWAAAREIMYRADHAGDGRRPPKEPEFVLGPTHEEIITPLVKTEITSYRDLPKNFYQIGTKFRNEIRPRYGLMRAREFIMKDAYSFDATDEAAIVSYEKMKRAYLAFFKRCGLKTIAVEADTGVMGGSYSHEFMVPAPIGDDDVVYSDAGYAANREKATSAIVPADLADAAPVGALEEFATPGIVTIAALAAAPYNVSPDKQFKTLVFMGDGKPFLVVVRGSDDVEEAKLGSLGFQLWRPATPEEIEPVMGAKPGSLGTVKGTIKNPGALAGIFADHAIRLVGNGTTGANKDGFHLRKVNVQRDLAVTKFGDFRRVREGEPSPKVPHGPLMIARAIEVGHVFKLGTKYSEKFGATFTDDKKQNHLMIMGCYGIGISRTLQAIIEQSNDADGIIWPWSVAPWQVLVVNLDPADAAASEVARKLAAAAEAAGADVLVDDRAERPGVKFKDADLIGLPLRLTVGGKGLKEGIVEMKWRTEKEVRKIPLADGEKTVADAVRQAMSTAPA
jgi:prolyl-tRNA synthetase